VVHRFYRFAAVVSRPAVHYLYRLDVRGRENLPTSGGFVLAANHVSNFDPWPLGIALYPQRELRFMAKSELYNPVLGPLLNAAGAFPVRRGEADVEAMATAIALAGRGEVIAMFPEGTRRSKGLRKKYEARPRAGAARIALEAGVPLVPAAISGTDRLLRFGKLKVAFGPPIPLDDLEELDRHHAVRIATERLMQEIYRLEQTLRG